MIARILIKSKHNIFCHLIVALFTWIARLQLCQRLLLWLSAYICIDLHTMYCTYLYTCMNIQFVEMYCPLLFCLLVCVSICVYSSGTLSIVGRIRGFYGFMSYHRTLCPYMNISRSVFVLSFEKLQWQA